MIQSNAEEEEKEEVAILAESLGFPYRIDISPELAGQLKPNEFLTRLGIQYSKRLKSLLSILKGNLLPENEGLNEALPKDGITIPFALVKGPFINEELISIRAELSDDGCEKVLKLIAILEG
jgi:hypothetical protein